MNAEPQRIVAYPVGHVIERRWRAWCAICQRSWTGPEANDQALRHSMHTGHRTVERVTETRINQT